MRWIRKIAFFNEQWNFFGSDLQRGEYCLSFQVVNVFYFEFDLWTRKYQIKSIPECKNFTFFFNENIELVVQVYSSVSFLYRISSTMFFTRKWVRVGHTIINAPPMEHPHIPHICHNPCWAITPQKIIVYEKSLDREMLSVCGLL